MKVSIDREELVKLREHVHMLVTERGDFREPAWLDAMTLLNAMIGKGEDHSVCKGCHFDGGDCYSQKKLGGWVNSCAMRVPATPPAPEYVARQEMEAAIKAALAERMEVHMQTTQHLWRSDVKREAECAVAKAMKAHEAEGHGVGQPSHDDCAHFIVCGLPKPCAGACGFYQKPLKS